MLRGLEQRCCSGLPTPLRLFALGQRKDVGPAIGQRLQLAAIGELDRQQIDEGRESAAYHRSVSARYAYKI